MLCSISSNSLNVLNTIKMSFNNITFYYYTHEINLDYKNNVLKQIRTSIIQSKLLDALKYISIYSTGFLLTA